MMTHAQGRETIGLRYLTHQSDLIKHQGQLFLEEMQLLKRRRKLQKIIQSYCLNQSIVKVKGSLRLIHIKIKGRKKIIMLGSGKKKNKRRMIGMMIFKEGHIMIRQKKRSFIRHQDLKTLCRRQIKKQQGVGLDKVFIKSSRIKIITSGK